MFSVSGSCWEKRSILCKVLKKTKDIKSLKWLLGTEVYCDTCSSLYQICAASQILAGP